MRGRTFITCAVATLWSSLAAAQQLPGPAEPGRIEPRFEAPPVPRAEPELIVPGPEAPLPPSEAEKVRFVLAAVAIDGATVYTTEQLQPLWSDKLGQTISLLDVYELRDAITARYRADGYVLSQAFIPAQDLTGGIVRIQIIEGYISGIVIEGEYRDSRGLIESMGQKITRSRPLNIRDLERYVLLMDDLPGATARTYLRPDPEAQGAAELVLNVEHDLIAGYAQADNYGSRAIGTEQLGAGIDLNSLLSLAEQTSFFAATTFDTEELLYGSVRHEEVLGTEGTRLSLSASFSHSEPGARLKPLDVDGRTFTARAFLTHPVIRSRSENLWVRGGFTIRNVETDILGADFSEDRLRFLSLGLTYDFSDTVVGDTRPAVTALSFDVSQGIDVFSATESGSPTLTRADGQSDFTKLLLEARRIQTLADEWSVALALAGQLSFDPLLASEEFGLGGSRFGRGYEPSELTGDDGIAGSVELRYDFDLPGVPNLRPTLYAFYDLGAVRNDNPPAGQSEWEWLHSAGGGIRAVLFDDITASFELAKPLNREIGSRDNKGIRALFSVTATF